MSTITEFIDNSKDTTIISFTGIGNDFGGIPPAEFRSLSLNYNMLFVTDDSRSWYNNIDVKKIISFLKKDQSIITLGNSMGAFNACCFTNDYKVKKCIMFATQYSVYPKIVPFETRWKKFVKNIDTWHNKHLIFNNTTDYFIIQGSCSKDMQHLQLIPDQPNIKKIIIPNGSHSVARQLKKNGKLHNILDSIINDKQITI